MWYQYLIQKAGLGTAGELQRRKRIIYGVLWAGALSLGIGCAADDSTTGVSDPGVGQATQGPQLATAEDIALQRLLAAERARTQAIQKRSGPVYDSLRAVWDRFRRTNPSRTNSPLVMCEPQTYSAESKIIGPNGGQIAMGTHHLIIPRGALARNTVITGERPVSTLISVELSPHGTVFLKQPTLQLNYSKCYLPSNYQYRVAYISDDNQILEYPRSVDKGGIVEAFIWHFSRYAVAY